jgi:hypothetical protein
MAARSRPLQLALCALPLTLAACGALLQPTEPRPEPPWLPTQPLPEPDGDRSPLRRPS